MRFILAFILTSLFLISCGNEEAKSDKKDDEKIEQKQVPSSEGKVTISGKIEGSANEEILFSINLPNAQPEEIGRTQTNENGEFSISVPINGIGYVSMNYFGQNMGLLVQAGENVQVNSNRDDLIQNVTLDGSVTMKVFNQYIQKVLAKREEMMGLSRKYNELKVANPAQADQIKSELDQILKGLNDWIKEKINENPDEPGMYVFLQYLGPSQGLINWDIENLDYHKLVLKAIETKYPDNPLTKKLASDISSWESQLVNVQKQKERIKRYGNLNRDIRIGKPAPDIFLDTPDGKEIKLSDLKGKVVLLDFWASWCGPCRKENPNVVNIYHKYKDKGFTVFSVSLDEKKDKWEQAIQTDGLIWENHVSDLQGWNSIAAQLYKVSSIPATFLIDKNGIIRAMNVRGATLEQKLLPLL